MYDTYDSYKVVADLLREIGYKAIAVCVEHDRNERFYNSCINLLLLKTPEKSQDHVRGILYTIGAIPSLCYKRARNNKEIDDEGFCNTGREVGNKNKFGS